MDPLSAFSFLPRVRTEDIRAIAPRRLTGFLMSIQRVRRVCLCVLVISLAACHDQPLVPDPPPTVDAADESAPLTAVGHYSCLTSVEVAGGGYRYGRVDLQFPQELLHPRSATHRYRYEAVDTQGKITRVLNCTIPRSSGAIRMMNRRVGGHEPGNGAVALDMQVFGCVSDGVCLLPPISGGGGGGGDGDKCDAYLVLSCGGDCMTAVFQSDGAYDTVAGCYTGGGSGGGSYGGGGTEVGGGTSPYPGDPHSWDDGTGRDPCVRNASGFCVTRELTVDEWVALAARVEELSEATQACAGAKNVLRGLMAQGRTAQRIRFWNGYDKVSSGEQRFGQNLSDIRGLYIEYDSFWVWDRGDKRTLLVHEGLHAYLNMINSPLMGQANEDWVEATAPTCL